MTKIFLASDLHNECGHWASNRRKVSGPPALSVADIVVMAGDIDYMPKALEYMGSLARKFEKPIIFVPGNHEFYGRDYEKMAELANIYEHENVHVLMNKSVVVQGVRFVGTPLWTNFMAFGMDYQADHMRLAEELVYDFHTIKSGGKFITAETMLGWHYEARKFLEGELSKDFDGKTVVVTHFPPSHELRHEIHKESEMSAYFNASCDSLIKACKPDAWFYGHTHAAVEKEIHGTKIYCNMGGYPREDQGITGFNAQKLIEV